MYLWPIQNLSVFFQFVLSISTTFLPLWNILKQILGIRVLDPVIVYDRTQISAHIQAILWTPAGVLHSTHFWCYLVGAVHKTQETVYLLDHQFIIKGYNSVTAKWKRCIGQGMRKGHSFYALFSCVTLLVSPHITNLEILSPVLLGFLEASCSEWLARLIKSLANCQLTQPSGSFPSLEVSGWNWKLESCNHIVGSSGNQPPSLGAFQRSTYQHNKDPWIALIA